MNIRKATLEDQAQIIVFLQEVAKRNKNQVLWLPQRWNYAISLVDSLYQERGYEGIFSKCYLGFEKDQLMAMVHIEDSNNVFVQLETPNRENYEVLLDLAEKEFAITENGERKIVVWAKASEVMLSELLVERAYKRADDCNFFNRADFNFVAEEVVLPKGYKILSLKEGASALDRHNAVHLSFNPDKVPDIQLPAHFIAMQSSELYDESWDFVCYDEANHPCGGFTIWIDQVSHTAMIEPLGTLLAYHGKGIGKALLTEGLHRLKKAGFEDVFVESYGESRREFYHKVGFRDFNKDYPYSRTL